QLQLEAEEQGIHLEPQPASRVKRAELLRTQDVRAALMAVPRDEATWHVPLGLASAVDPEVEVLYLQTLRPGRGSLQEPRRVWIQPEDDVPHIRDRIYRARDTVGLRSGQVRVAHSVSAAAAAALGSDDFVLGSVEQAREVGLVRGFAVFTTGGEDLDRLRSQIWDGIADCVGAVASGRRG